ncbi:cardiolipin synthase [Enterococcus casseliflavus]|uniref:cardiolipin synthase n=1 Tax=Enterococcus casseliflavus TaxID=37734 RepID=UPI000E481CF2|nr:cardiolipin synthase [Enterococcus casseliflavus]RHH55850.1 cardiolipin synthase [Enterococcus casseliflavus]
MIKMDMSMISTVLLALLFINTIAAFITVFRKPRSIASVFAWMMTLVFIPGIGFLLYLFCGRGIDGEIIYKFSEHHQSRINELNQIIKVHNYSFPEHPYSDDNHLLERYFKNLDESPLTKGNKVEFYKDGKEKFAALFEDMKQAEDNLHVEYYSFFNDEIGGQFLSILIDKAREGVEVRLVYDPWGSPKANRKFFQPLIDAGGKVVPFITSKNLIRNTRLNYHLHRKIVVIDGQIGWTGGFNVGDQYLGKKAKFGYWRDTHARIVGTASFTLQEIFIRDWNASVKREEDQLEYEDRYFILPPKERSGNVDLQIVADGPESETQILKGGFVKMILAAKESIWIQTPYLIPDDSMMNALEIAIHSGVDVRIMIPCMPDHPFIYRATQHYANYLHRRGAKIYIYNNGFLHAKTVMMDDTISSFGTTNQDIRSYALNFEVNAFAYDHDVTQTLKGFFEEDMAQSTLLTDEILAKQSYWLRFKQNFSRLLSPIL